MRMCISWMTIALFISFDSTEDDNNYKQKEYLNILTPN